MSARRRLAAVLCVGALGPAALGALSSACNSLSGIGDFTVGGEEAGTAGPDGSVAGDGASEAWLDSPSPGQDGTSTDGTPSDGATPPDARGDAVEAGDGAGVGPDNDGGDGGEGGPRADGGRGDAGDGGADTGGGTGPCDGGTALVVHSNGLGQTFTDCAPLGTFNQTQALAACTVHTGDAGACTVNPITCGAGDQVCGMGTSMCACWRYNGTSAGHVENATTCNCLGSSAPTWN